MSSLIGTGAVATLHHADGNFLLVRFNNEMWKMPLKAICGVQNLFMIGSYCVSSLLEKWFSIEKKIQIKRGKKGVKSIAPAISN